MNAVIWLNQWHRTTNNIDGCGAVFWFVYLEKYHVSCFEHLCLEFRLTSLQLSRFGVIVFQLIPKGITWYLS